MRLKNVHAERVRSQAEGPLLTRVPGDTHHTWAFTGLWSQPFSKTKTCQHSKAALSLCTRSHTTQGASAEGHVRVCQGAGESPRYSAHSPKEEDVGELVRFTPSLLSPQHKSEPTGPPGRGVLTGPRWTLRASHSPQPVSRRCGAGGAGWRI